MAKTFGKRNRKQGGMLISTNSCQIWSHATLISCTLNLVLCIALISLYIRQQSLWLHSTISSCSTKDTIIMPTPNSKAPVASDDSRTEDSAVNKEINVGDTSGVLPTSKDAIINLNHGDPTMYEEFWKATGDKATIVIPGWNTMSYFSDVSNLCWFLEPEFAKQITRLHNVVGNAVTDGYYIIVGTGSTQLFQSALYALSPSDSTEPMSVVSDVPWYSSYPSLTDFLQSNLFRWAGDANKFKGEKYIELVCSPNNPDGSIRKPVLNSKSGKTIHDLAYYWPQYTPITGPAEHDIMLFTVSKCTGHAGSRLGWGLVKNHDVAKRMMKFIELNTIGVSKDSQLRAAQILKVISDAYESPDSKDSDKLFSFGRTVMADRWRKLQNAVKASGIFSIPQFPTNTCKFSGESFPTYPAFAWLKCEKEDVNDCEEFMKSHKILTRSGVHSGVSAKYSRISMLDRDETFNIFIERLTSLK